MEVSEMTMRAINSARAEVDWNDETSPAIWTIRAMPLAWRCNWRSCHLVWTMSSACS